MSRMVRRALAALDGVEESVSAFKDDIGYWVNGKEIAHFEGDLAARRRRFH